MFKRLLTTNIYNKRSTYLDTLRNIDNAYTLIPNSYYCSNFFNIEKDKIFKKGWIPIGYTNQLDTSNIISSTIHDIPIIITKSKNNQIKSYYNICRHRGCKLVDNNKSSSVIVCPYHKWTYSLNGDLIGTPLYKPSKDIFNKKNYSLFPIKTEIQNNIIFGNLDKSNDTTAKEYYKDCFNILDDYPLDKCTIVKETQYNINCNWKLLIDNFIEYYHLPAVHPKLVKNSGMNDHKCTQGDGMYIGFKTDPLTSSGEIIDIENATSFSNLSNSNKHVAHFQMLFPNMFYFLFPNHIFSIIIQPISPTKSIEKAVLMVEDTTNIKWIDDLWEFYNEVNIEDINVCEKVQKGLKCDVYKGGRMVPEFESTIHRFHKMIISNMLDSKILDELHK